MNGLITQLNGLAEFWEGELQIEENGQKIAKLQGRIAGYRRFIALLNQENVKTSFKGEILDVFPLHYLSDSEKWSCWQDDYFKMMEWEKEAKEADLVLNKILKRLNELVNEKKNWLFYYSTKSRDLHFIKGWYFSMSLLSDWCVAIHEGFHKAKEKHDQELALFEDGEESGQ